MNLLRFKSPALIELVTPSANPGVFTSPLTRDIKVVNAFGFAGAAHEDSSFQIFTVSQGVRQNISKQVPLRLNETSYINEIDTNWDECVESFDAMDLREDLLRGIYAYGACGACAGAGCCLACVLAPSL